MAIWILVFVLTLAVNAGTAFFVIYYIAAARKQDARSAAVDADAFHHCILKIGYLETKMAEADSRISALEQEVSGLRGALRDRISE
ncbi:hypothetical protein [Succinimonas amylolytica]|uniref:hypothetical protein n=1 Tax=Succinimonas amylolytica TaxID=83769 RepID=UPI00146135E0|nr:hypothetical protein [Succinimonas amylolytica]